MKTTIAFIALVLVGCEAEIEITTPAIYHCTDFRDGEKFSFDNETTRDAEVVGFSDACVTVTDFDGKSRRLCKAHFDDWLKCEEERK